MTTRHRIQLSAMMFAQYFVWGVWWVPFGAYLAKHGLDASIGTIFSTQGWAAIVAPLFVGAIADRHFSAQRVMAVLHLAGGALLLALSLVGADPAVMFVAALGVMLCYMPTIALSNAVAFNVLDDTEKQFPAIRVWGTLGWILGGLLVGRLLHAEQTATPIRIAAAASLAYGLYCFTLPDTPPRARGTKTNVLSLLGLDVIGAVRDRSFWILIGCSLLLMIPLSFYYAYTNAFLVEVGVQSAAAVQTLGQVSEIGFLLLLPVFFRYFGIKWVLLIGMLAWAARYVLFAHGYGPAGPVMPALLVGLALHGVCFDFFFVAGQIYVDKRFPPETRGRAQSFLSLVTWGVGSVIGGVVANAVYVANTHGGAHDWRYVWVAPAVLALVVALIFALAFKDRRPVLTENPA